MAKKKTSKKSFLTLSCILFGIVLLILLVLLAHHGKTEKGQEISDTTEKAEEKVEQSLVFPYKMDKDRLEIESVFQYSGMNPDCKEEEGDEIGAIQVKNCSGQYLESAELTMTTADGQIYHFLVEDLPAGSSAMAFELTNKELPTIVSITQMEGTTSYAEQASAIEDAVSATAGEAGITLKNISAEPMQNLTVIYHCMLDDVYFGGKSYQQQVESLGVGESTTIRADECYLGEAAVVKIID